MGVRRTLEVKRLTGHRAGVRMRRLLLVAPVAGVVALCAAGTAVGAVEGGAPATELLEHRVDGPEPKSRLYLRERRPADSGGARTARGVVLFLPPFGVPSAAAFDVAGYSWLEYTAQKGFDSWALDFRGFGQSTRPPEMTQPPTQSGPVVRAPDAVADVERAVEYILHLRGTDRVALVGWSWGAVVAGMYAAKHPDRVGKLVLYGAMHGFELPWMAKPFVDPARPREVNPGLPAYQVVPVSALIGHWDMMLQQISGPSKPVRSPEALASVIRTFLESDPAPPKEGYIRRPMGPLVDLYYIWTSRPLFDASRIQVPTLLIRGDRDAFADPTFLERLTRAPYRREVVIADATHWLIYETNHWQLFREVQNFLDEQEPRSSPGPQGG